MTIEKGQPWGTEVPSGAEVISCADDQSLARAVHHQLSAAGLQSDGLQSDGLQSDGLKGVHYRVEAGDLLQTVGGHRPAGPTSLLLPMDLGLVSLDGGEQLPFVANVIVRRALWSGEAAAVMNAAWLDDWYLGPRAHPNDGLLDITVGALRFAERMQARSRARSGTHVPHPNLTTKRVQTWTHTFAKRSTVRVDGVSFGRIRHLRVELLPDAFTLAT